MSRLTLSIRVAALVCLASVPVFAAEVRVGCWNIEWFKAGKQRGFPENTGRPRGPAYASRTREQVAELARTIHEDTGMSFVVLSEINGTRGVDSRGRFVQVSPELDGLLEALPPDWTYILGRTGGEQRLALLFDRDVCRVNEVVEFEIPPRKVQRKDIFDRDPLACHVTLFEDGSARNDLVIVGVHLASGQNNHKNHDAAMEKLRELLDEARARGQLGGKAEHDILIMGDLNANMFRPPVERFFVEMDGPSGDWDVLADEHCPATRLSGVPLALRDSHIDYIIATRKTRKRNGLAGEEITIPVARVHTEMLESWPADEFRKALSDHLPVTIAVRLMDDTD